MSIADPLSRLARQEHRLDNLDLPVLLEMLFKELPTSVKKATNLRVNAEKDVRSVSAVGRYSYVHCYIRMLIRSLH